MTLVERLLILALAAQVFLTLGVLMALGRSRLPMVARKEIAISDIAVDRDAWPLKARLISNSFDNQFQLPVLFYVAGLLTLWAGHVGWVELVLAWLFVVSRLIHALIHTTTNSVIPRFQAYFSGMMILMIYWVWLVVRLVILVPSVN